MPAKAQRSSHDVVEGFSEPYRQVKIAFSEAGILKDIAVREGQSVTAGSVIARLDDRVQQVMLKIATAGRDSHGDLDAAASEHELRKGRWEALDALHRSGHATQEEVLRAESELKLAAAQLESAREKRTMRELEYERIVTQLQMLQARAPINGVITGLHKQPGEYVGAIDPVVATLVQLDTLSVVFMFPRDLSLQLRAGEPAMIRFADSDRQAAAVVEYVSPVANPESNTVTVRVRVPNPDRTLAAGERCQFLVGVKPAPQQATVPRPSMRIAAGAASLLRRLPMPQPR